MNRTICTLLLCLATCGLQAQTTPRLPAQVIDVNASVDSQGSVQFNLVKDPNHYGSYTVAIRFTNLSNASGERMRLFSVDRSCRLFSLRPLDAEQPVCYAYTFRYVRGSTAPRADTLFRYRLPFGEGLVRKATLLQPLGERAKNQGLYGVSFRLERGDTVYAMRKGVVTEVSAGRRVEVGQGERTLYNRNASYLLVEHADGTLARYSVIDENNLFVQVGQTLYPDTPLALAGTLDGNFYQVRVMVTAVEANLAALRSDADDPFSTRFFVPLFQLAQSAATLRGGEECRCAVPPELVTREMSRREAKRRAAKR